MAEIGNGIWVKNPRTAHPIFEQYEHRLGKVIEDNQPCSFHWHFPRGTFRPRMSALEIAEFVLPHMPSIVPLLSKHPRIQAEFQSILVMLATTPKSALDRLMTWIKPKVGTGPDDLIEMTISGPQIEQPEGPSYFGAAK